MELANRDEDGEIVFTQSDPDAALITRPGDSDFVNILERRREIADFQYNYLRETGQTITQAFLLWGEQWLHFQREGRWIWLLENPPIHLYNEWLERGAAGHFGDYLAKGNVLNRIEGDVKTFNQWLHAQGDAITVSDVRLAMQSFEMHIERLQLSITEVSAVSHSKLRIVNPQVNKALKEGGKTNTEKIANAQAEAKKWLGKAQSLSESDLRKEKNTAGAADKWRSYSGDVNGLPLLTEEQKAILKRALGFKPEDNPYLVCKGVISDEEE